MSFENHTTHGAPPRQTVRLATLSGTLSLAIVHLHQSAFLLGGPNGCPEAHLHTLRAIDAVQRHQGSPVPSGRLAIDDLRKRLGIVIDAFNGFNRRVGESLEDFPPDSIVLNACIDRLARQRNELVDTLDAMGAELLALNEELGR